MSIIITIVFWKLLFRNVLQDYLSILNNLGVFIHILNSENDEGNFK